MKQIALLILLVLVTSCGGTKKAIENSESTKQVEKTKITNTSEPEIKVEKEIDTEVKTKEETPTKTEVMIKDSEIKVETKTEAFNHDVLNTLLQTHVSKNGNVNYKNIKAQRTELYNYIKLLTDNTPTDTWSREDKLAYWINAYNALTVDLILKNYPLKSIKDIDKPWDQRLWKFGDKWLNLNDIEHQILRKMDEPRIHFAIVCASFSCPKLLNEAYTASNLEEQLTRVTKEFLADEDRNNISENNLKLSKIFKWFAKDFKTNGSLIDFLNEYTEVEISSKAKKSFKDYNWDLND
ncbi:DUF547 domain-containing protein [Winogradskyella haliclonae]|uniref:DUF547 domain-containing protein n=1 Tax=Winogradskyella haliclonae TaxID=2048558 RepID=A0ABQ2BYM7_9FLAO|nr:DUF547 domain-containing protein [Winogradskyella haliclonae]GGI56667.1 hypothetical protein GCM10011444_09760 [Winogradskyella haliclonae]